MKRLGSCCVLLVAGMVHGCSDDTVIRPSAHLTTAAIDLGLIRATDPPVEGRFVILNESTVPVEIDELVPSCACVRIVSFDRHVPAHGEAQVTFRLQPRGLLGSVTQQVVARTAGGADFDVAHIEAMVVPTAYAQPSAVDLSGRGSDSSIVTVPGSDSVLELRSAPPGVSVSVTQLPDPGPATRYRVDLTAEDPSTPSTPGQIVSLRATSENGVHDLEIWIEPLGASQNPTLTVLLPEAGRAGQLHPIWEPTLAQAERATLSGDAGRHFDLVRRGGHWHLSRRESRLPETVIEGLLQGDGDAIVPVRISTLPATR